MLVREQDALHQRAWRACSDLERRVLLLIAANPAVQPTAARTLEAHKLGPKTSVSRTVNQLITQEVLVVAGRGAHHFDDPFFRRWIELNAFVDIGRPVPSLLPTTL